MASERPTRSRPVLPLALAVLAILVSGVWQLRRHADPVRDTEPAASASTPSADSTPPAVRPSPGAPDSHDLSVDERRGGHTLARHVGRSDEELRDRLAREPNISAASTYTDREAAEVTVARALAGNAPRIAAWLAREGNRPNLALDYRGLRGEIIGRSLTRGAQSAVPCTDALVVLRAAGRDGYYVLTSYPETRR